MESPDHFDRKATLVPVPDVEALPHMAWPAGAPLDVIEH